MKNVCIASGLVLSTSLDIRLEDECITLSYACQVIKVENKIATKAIKAMTIKIVSVP